MQNIKWPQVRNIKKYLRDIEKVLTSEAWTIRAQNRKCNYYTEKFEEKWSELNNSKFCVAVSSGSSALEICLKTIRISIGDEVIVPVMGWYATAAAVVKVGAIPIFCDIDINTSCIDINCVKKLISNKTKALIAVHLHSSFAPMEQLQKLCNKYKIILLEDAAQAHGGQYNGYFPGYYSLAACYSFNQEKLIPAGEGGAIITNNKEFYDTAYAMRTDGYHFCENKGWVPFGILGSNFAMTEFQSAILLNVLEEFQYYNSIRLRNAELIYKSLSKINGIDLIAPHKKATKLFFYEIGIRFSKEILKKLPLDKIITEINSYGIIRVDRTDDLVPFNPLFSPYYLDQDINKSYTQAEELYNCLLVMHHKYLLVDGIDKILEERIKNLLKK